MTALLDRTRVRIATRCGERLAPGTACIALRHHRRSTPVPPDNHVAATGLFALASLMGAFVPAHRAAKLDAMDALRGE